MKTASENSKFFTKIKDNFSGVVTKSYVERDTVIHEVNAADIHKVCEFVKNDVDLLCDFLADVVAIDYGTDIDGKVRDGGKRFGIVYVLYSVRQKERLHLKIRFDEGESVKTVMDIWMSADCAEREAFDMFGMKFDGHENLTRVYLAQDWEGHPLRKDYPLKGFKDTLNPFGEEKDG